MASQEPIYCHLTDDGLVPDATNYKADVNGSSIAVPFSRGPADNDEIWAVHRMILMLESCTAPQASEYGDIATLANGVTLKVMSGSNVITDLTDAVPVKSNANWGAHCYDVSYSGFAAGTFYTLVRWTFSHAGRPLILDGFTNEQLVFTVNDDLSTLVSHTAQIQGHVIHSPDQQLNTWGA